MQGYSLPIPASIVYCQVTVPETWLVGRTVPCSRSLGGLPETPYFSLPLVCWPPFPLLLPSAREAQQMISLLFLGPYAPPAWSAFSVEIPAALRSRAQVFRDAFTCIQLF